MNIAAMRVRVTFQKNTVIVDKYGNHKTGWADYFFRCSHLSGGLAGLHLPLLL